MTLYASITAATIARLVGSGAGLVALVRTTWRLHGSGTFPIVRLVRRELPRSPGDGRVVLVCSAAGLLMVAIPVAWALVTGQATFARDGAWTRAPVLAIVATVAAKLLFVLFEELTFRSALIGELSRRVGAPAAVMLGALAFAVAHGRDPIATGVLVADGVGFGAVYVATRTLWGPIAWHAAKNLSVWLLVGESTIQFAPGPVRLTPADASTTSAPGTGPMLATSVVIAAAMIGWLAARSRTRANHRQDERSVMHA